MTYNVDQGLFKQLALLDSSDVCHRSMATFNRDQGCYTINLWDGEYAVYPEGEKIERLDPESGELHDYFHVFVINYLLQIKDIPLTGEWISEKDISGGSTFFRGPHEIPTNQLSDTFLNDIETFCRVCELFHGEPLEMADAAYRFRISSRVVVAVLYWQGDDDFPPEAKLLFDRSISEHFALDTLFALAVEVCSRLVSANCHRP
jgi:hypothetical protein